MRLVRSGDGRRQNPVHIPSEGGNEGLPRRERLVRPLDRPHAHAVPGTERDDGL